MLWEGPTLLMAQFSHVWTNTRGEDVEGLREVALCPVCDRGQPAAEELLTLLAMEEQLDSEHAETFSELVAAWVDSVRHRLIDTAVLNDEHERWRHGEL